MLAIALTGYKFINHAAAVVFPLMVVGVPLMFVANILLALLGTERHRLAHLLAIAGYTLTVALWWRFRGLGAWVILLIPNIVAGHFLLLAVPAWLSYRKKMAEWEKELPPPYHGPRCVRCEAPIEAGIEMCPRCGWAQPV